MNTIKLLEEKGIDFLPKNNVSSKYLPEKNAYILNYEQIETNRKSEYRKYHPVVRECRSLIVRKKDDKWQMLARSFERFFNWNENLEEAKIIAEAMQTKGQVVAYEKLDGSLITLTYFDEDWHIFTRNSNADATQFRGMPSFQKNKTTFGDHVRQFLNLCKLDKNYSYIFELCTPGAHITKYDKEFLSLLTVIDKATNEELSLEMCTLIANENDWKIPEIFFPSNIDEVFARIAAKPKDYEGYVLRYKSLRMKVKSDTYITMHHLGTNIITEDDIIKVILDGEAAELKTAARMEPYIPYIDSVSELIDSEMKRMEDFLETHLALPQKEFAKKVGESAFVFSWLLFEIKSGKILKENLRKPWGIKDKDKFLNKFIGGIKKSCSL